MHQKIIPGVTSISQTKLPDFLSGNYIYVWDKKRVSTLLRQLFGSGIDFNLCDLQEEISKLMPVFRTKSVEDLYFLLLQNIFLNQVRIFLRFLIYMLLT